MRAIRLPENRPAYVAMNWQPDNGRRRPGRPTKTWWTTFNEDLHDGTYMDGCKEICQRQTEMDKARRPMFQQQLEELRSKVRNVNGKRKKNKLSLLRSFDNIFLNFGQRVWGPRLGYPAPSGYATDVATAAEAVATQLNSRCHRSGVHQ